MTKPSRFQVLSGFGLSAVLGSLTSAAKVYFGPWGLVAWPCCETEAPSGNYRGDGGSGGRCKDSGVRGFLGAPGCLGHTGSYGLGQGL